MIPSIPSSHLIELVSGQSESIRLDLDNQCLWMEGQVVELSPKAFQLLHYLALHEQEVLSHRKLCKLLWPDTHVDPHNLKKYIVELRRVLKDDAKLSRFIETLPRRGYRFLTSIRVLPSSSLSVELPSSSRTNPLVQRNNELVELNASYDRVLQGQRQFVFVSGNPGLGKTALVEEFLRQVSAKPATAQCYTVHCFHRQGQRCAYLPLFALLDQLREADHAKTVGAAIEQHAPSWLPHLLGQRFEPQPSEPHSSHIVPTLALEISRLLETLARTTPLILVFEDMHWSDPDTLDFLNTLARRQRKAKLMVLVTFRPTLPDASDVLLRTVKRDLVCHAMSKHIELTPLTLDSIALYLSEGPAKLLAPHELTNLLYRNSGGNPFLMRAGLEVLVEQGVCCKEHGSWKLYADHANASVPSRISQFLEIELGALLSEDIEFLEACSIIGDTFSSDQVAAILEQDTHLVRHRLDRFARSGQFLCRSTSRVTSYRFTVGMFRDIIYGRMSPEQQQQMHFRFATWLEAQAGVRDPSVGCLLARHFQEAHEWARAVPYLLLSTDDSGRATALEQALKLLNKAGIDGLRKA